MIAGAALAGAIALTTAGTAGIVKYGAWLRQQSLRPLASNPTITYQLHYQPGALVIAATVAGIASLFGDFNYVEAGDFAAPVSGFGWLGMANGTSWRDAGIAFALLPALGTTVVAGIQVLRNTRPAGSEFAAGLLWALPLSLTNSLTEELIFRSTYGQLVGTSIAAMTVALISGATFGGPHYFGTPGKAIGVLMAGWLGWMMMLSMLQTGGIGWAWVIHFAQDVPILTFMIAADAPRTTE